jgi:pimeloyl-ACP methyl ester carboxylesterase
MDILGIDYRLYYESAGRGIPLFLQNTAGCHGSQSRHLMECSEITDHFQLIAYDLPFHGKSMPPVGPKWWAEEYHLTADFVHAIPLALSDALELDRPVFMGCSVGSLLALDLARFYSDHFRAVEGALNIDDPIELIHYFWHPQLSNEFKARMMNALMAPISHEAYRKESSQIYGTGWPPAFLGDLNYYGMAMTCVQRRA